MKFQITPETKQLILHHGSQIMVRIEREECYACAGQVNLPSLSAELGIPKDSQLDEYEILAEDDINIYVHNIFESFDTADTLAIDLSHPLNTTLVIYGIVPQN